MDNSTRSEVMGTLSYMESTIKFLEGSIFFRGATTQSLETAASSTVIEM